MVFLSNEHRAVEYAQWLSLRSTVSRSVNGDRLLTSAHINNTIMHRYLLWIFGGLLVIGIAYTVLDMRFGRRRFDRCPPTPVGLPSFTGPLLLVLTSWAACILDPLSIILVPGIFLFGFIYFIIRRNLEAIIILALNPLVLFFIGGFIGGVVDYMGHRPHLTVRGLSIPEIHNIDPKTRCFQYGRHGGIFLLLEIITESHNMALRTLATRFGPPKHSYDGPYPNKKEAVEAVKQGTPITRANFASGIIPLADHPVKLDPKQTAWICSAILQYNPDDPSPPHDSGNTEEKLIAAQWQSRCLVVQQQWIGEKNDIIDIIVLIDIKTTRPFAIYRLNKNSRVPYNEIESFWK